MMKKKMRFFFEECVQCNITEYEWNQLTYTVPFACYKHFIIFIHICFPCIHLAKQWWNQSINQSIIHLGKQRWNQSINQSYILVNSGEINEIINQLINQSIKSIKNQVVKYSHSFLRRHQFYVVDNFY
jgi:hypothetical protein